MHLWHDLPLGKNFPEEFNAIIEIPKNSSVKYELDKETGLIKVDRMLYSAMYYPLNYGFIPKTYCEDDDPLDVLVLGEHALVPGCILTVRPIAYTHMIDGGEEDAKILAVPTHDPELSHLKDLNDLSPHLIKKVENFFQTYKILQNKEVSGIKTHGRDTTLAVVKQASEDYLKKFKT